MASNVKKHQEKLDRAYSKYSDAMDSLQLADPTNMDTYKKVKEGNDDKYMAMIERIMAKIKDINTPAPPAAAMANAGPGGGRQAQEPNSRLALNLKLTVLNEDFNLVEFKAWSMNFQSYYRAGHMDTLQLEDQQALWKICIDPNLEIKIKALYDHTTPIFGPTKRRYTP